MFTENNERLHTTECKLNFQDRFLSEIGNHIITTNQIETLCIQQ